MTQPRLLIIALVAALAGACVDTDRDPTAALDEAPAPMAIEIGESTVATAVADKVEIDPAGLTTCDGDNSKCFTADQAKCPDTDGKYTGKCWCTHCEGGNVCEGESDHNAHDEKCKLKTAAEALDVGAL